MGLVCAPAGTVLPVDLEDLVPETQASQGGGRVRLHQLDEDPLGQKKVPVSAQVGVRGQGKNQRNRETEGSR